MISLLLALSASVPTSLLCALRVRRQSGRVPATRIAAPVPDASTLWSTALSASLLLFMACGIAVFAPAPLGAADRLSGLLCLAAGLGFLGRLAVLLRRLGGAGLPGARLARSVLLTGPAGPLAATWAVLRAPLQSLDDLAPAPVAAIRLDGHASSALRSSDLPELPASTMPLGTWVCIALMLCAAFPPVRMADGLAWSSLLSMPAGAHPDAVTLGLEMLLVIGLAVRQGLQRQR